MIKGVGLRKNHWYTLDKVKTVLDFITGADLLTKELFGHHYENLKSYVTDLV